MRELKDTVLGVRFAALPRQQHICWMYAITHLYVMFCVLLQSSHFKLLLEHVFRKLGDIHFAWCPIHCCCLILQFLSQQFPSTQLPNVCFYNYPCWDISRLTCVTKTERPWTWRHAQLTHLQLCWTTEGQDLFLSKFISCKAWRSILWYTVSLLSPQMLIKWICLLQFQLQNCNFEVLSVNPTFPV